MQAPFLQALKHRRELPGRPHSLDALVRGVFREMQLADRVGVHGPVSRRAIETTRIHLGNVSQHDRRDASFLSYMSVQTLENNPIAEMRQRIALHCELPDGGGRRGQRSSTSSLYHERFWRSERHPNARSRRATRSFSNGAHSTSCGASSRAWAAAPAAIGKTRDAQSRYASR